MLQGEALAVHLFIRANSIEIDVGPQIRSWWDACVTNFGFTETFPGSGAIGHRSADTSSLTAGALLAAQIKPVSVGYEGSAVEAALLYRRQETFCVTVAREPEGNATWADLDRGMGELSQA